MNTRTLISAAFALCLGQAAQAADYELSLAHWVPATHPLQVLGMEPWAKSIEEASGGRIHITIYPAQQLGAAADHYDMARDGIADISFINPGYQPGRFPILAAGELPFTFANAKGGVRALTEWYKPYAEKEMSDTYFCMAISHTPGTFHGKEQVLVPEDIKGKTVRPANGTEARFVNLLGGASVQVSVAEMRDALAKGAADVTMSPWQSLYIFGVDELVKHHLDMPFYLSINAFIFNKDTIAGMPQDLQQVIYDHCTPEWAEKMSSGWADAELAGRDKLLQDPTQIMDKPTPEQAEEWKAAAAPLTDEWKANMAKQGLDGDQMLADLHALLQKYNSEYSD